MKLNPSEGLSSSHAVFTGEVTGIEPNEATRFGGLEITLRVKEVWKGAVEAEVKVRTAGSSAACGYNFVKGETYLVYALNDDADPMRVSLCSRTALVENAKEDLDFLGKPSHRFDADTRSKKERRKDNCSASPGTSAGSSLGWMALLLAGTALTRRRLA
jgi:MYXO-CTERM domain-containing protein